MRVKRTASPWEILGAQLRHLAATAATTLTGLALALVIGVLLALPGRPRARPQMLGCGS